MKTMNGLIDDAAKIVKASPEGGYVRGLIVLQTRDGNFVTLVNDGCSIELERAGEAACVALGKEPDTPSTTLEAERDVPGLWGFVVDVSNQPCRMEAEGASPDFPCHQTSACATEWCDPCRARMTLAATQERTDAKG